MASEKVDLELFPSEGQSLNLSLKAAEYLERFGKGTRRTVDVLARQLFLHITAVLYAPDYRIENATPLRQDWPRIPLPASRKVLEASAALGEQVAALLDTEADVPGVTSGRISPVFKTIGLITKVGGGAIDPSGDDLSVTASWGHFGKAGVVMPAKGKTVERAFNADEAKAIDAEAAVRGISAKDACRLLGERTIDVYLNEAAYWRNIPAAVWEYCIGGYQVIKKWLSYREDEILDRALKPEEAREVMNTARRIAALILLQPKLDDNYREVKAATFDWAGKA